MFDDFFSQKSQLSPNAQGFEHFDLLHFFWLFAAAAAAVILYIICRRKDERGRRALRRAVGITLLCSHLFRVVILVATGEYGIGYLPLHLCGMSVYIEIFDSLFPNRFTHELCYAVCMPGAAMAMLFPDWTAYPFFNYIHLSGFIIHALLVIYPILLFCGGDFLPDIRRLPLCLLYLISVAVPVFFFNKHFNVNYMFLNRPAAGTPLVWFDQQWGNPGYIAGMPLIAAALWLFMYLPPVLINKRRLKNNPDRTTAPAA